MTGVDRIVADLVGRGLLRKGRVTATPLTGGVSSDIRLLSDGRRNLVIKQALARLRVREPWHADVSRNLTEQRYLRLVASIWPAAVPAIVHSNPELDYFAMEYLEGLATWKSHLLDGEADPALARRAGEIMGGVHLRTAGDGGVAAVFDTVSNFHALRSEPYLLTAAARHPRLRSSIEAETRRLEGTRLCLVHGDFSPKNIMIGGRRLVVIDAEVAWYGEPAFDTAFLFSHFLLKALYHRRDAERFIALLPAAWEGYRSVFPSLDPGLERRTGRLLLMLLLARVDGKSPAEYLDEEASKDIVRGFVHALLPLRRFDLEEICGSWRRQLHDPARLAQR